MASNTLLFLTATTIVDLIRAPLFQILGNPFQREQLSYDKRVNIRQHEILDTTSIKLGYNCNKNLDLQFNLWCKRYFFGILLFHMFLQYWQPSSRSTSVCDWVFNLSENCVWWDLNFHNEIPPESKWIEDWTCAEIPKMCK